MKKARLIVPALIFAAAVSITGSVLSQDRQDPPARDVDPMQFMKPGKAHERLTRYVGEYTTTTRFAVPGMDAIESTGTATVTSALGDRFIVVDSKGAMMGEPYTSVQWYGYNNVSKRYESVWMWTMGTAMMQLDGETSDNGATVKWTATYHGEDGKETLNVITRFDESDRFVVEMRPADDEPGPVMTTTYTRRN